MSLNYETLNKIKQQEETRKAVPTLDELFERLKLITNSPNDITMFLHVFRKIACGDQLFSPQSKELQQFAAQAMVILLLHVQKQQ